jgi:hypothetical protein
MTAIITAIIIITTITGMTRTDFGHERGYDVNEKMTMGTMWVQAGWSAVCPSHPAAMAEHPREGRPSIIAFELA